MRLVSASTEVITEVSGEEMLRRLEAAGRTCYKSEDRVTNNSARAFVARIIESGHHSVLEHESVSVRFVVDRGVSHEIVRHRLASYSQESTRYCNYGKAKFGGEVTFVDARPHLPPEAHDLWMTSVESSASDYLELLELGVPPQMARSVLPNALKTELVMTCNVREWRHFFSLRTTEKAHPQMREVARPLLRLFRSMMPVLFDDVGVTGEGDD